jgi:hypothetical protein
MTMLRRTAGTAAVVLLAGLPVAASADPPQTAACSPSDPTFCLSYGAAVYAPGTTTAETNASGPFDFSLALTNTSPSHGSDQQRWLKSLTIDLVSGSTGGVQLTPSSQLPDGLMIAGSSAGCAPGGDNSFSACTAGHGTAVINVSGLPSDNGYKTATFGIQRITNVAATSSLGEYDVEVSLCVPFLGNACFVQAPSSVSVVISPGVSGSPATHFDVATSGSTTQATVTVDYALDAGSINLHGTADRLGDGSQAGQSYTVLRLPAGCGTASAAGSARSKADAVVTVPLAVTLTGCPVVGPVTAAGTSTRAAHLSTSASSPLGRTVTSYRWTFDDGSSATTATPAADHTFASAGSHSGTVTAVDALGAVSVPAGFTVRNGHGQLAGKKRVASGTKVTLTARLDLDGTPVAGATVRLLRCNKKGKRCRGAGTATTSAKGTASFRTKVTKTSRYQAVFEGGSARFAVVAEHLVKVKAKPKAH